MNNQNLNPEAMITRPEPKGPVFGIVIIIVLLIVGGIYVFLTGGGPKEAQIEDNVAEELSTQGTSTDIDAIEADVMNTDLGDLSAPLDSLEAEVTAQ